MPKEAEPACAAAAGKRPSRRLRAKPRCGPPLPLRTTLGEPDGEEGTPGRGSTGPTQEESCPVSSVPPCLLALIGWMRTAHRDHVSHRCRRQKRIREAAPQQLRPGQHSDDGDSTGRAKGNSSEPIDSAHEYFYRGRMCPGDRRIFSSPRDYSRSARNRATAPVAGSCFPSAGIDPRE